MRDLGVVVAALPLLFLLVPVPLVEARSAAFVTRTRASPAVFLLQRGGATTIDLDEDEYDEYDEEEDEEDYEIAEEVEDEYDEEEEDELDSTLVKSAVKATAKQTAKQATATKQAVSAKLLAKKSKRPSLLKRYVPYIVRACLSPVTVMAMWKGYFASLINLDFLAKEDSSQDLRSALEEKAKKSGSAGGGRKGKRAMRPGQAKTLSDLPQLST